MNLQELRLYKDAPLQGSYDPNYSDTVRKQGRELRVLSYGSLHKAVSLLDLFLNFMSGKRQQILSSFTQECIEKCKPLVDVLYTQLTTLQVADPVKVQVSLLNLMLPQTTEELLKFFISFRDRTAGNPDEPQTKLAEFMVQFLQPIVLQFEGPLADSYNLALGTMLLVKCFEADSLPGALQDNKLFEVPSSVKYLELQDIINKKYGGMPTQLSFIDEQEETITIDSDLVLQKAI